MQRLRGSKTEGIITTFLKRETVPNFRIVDVAAEIFRKVEKGAMGHLYRDHIGNVISLGGLGNRNGRIEY